jgi:6-phosphofructokinase
LFFFVRLDRINGNELQFKQAEETAKKLDLDGLVVIGGDDSNTNACLLAENFRYALMEVCGCTIFQIGIGMLLD